MDFVNGPVPFGEWMPDSEDLIFPNLVEARNVEPNGIVYKTFDPLNNDFTATVVPAGEVKGFAIGFVAGSEEFYVGGNFGLLRQQAPGGALVTVGAATTAAYNEFIQYEDLMIVARYPASTAYHTAGSATVFSTLGSTAGSAPPALHAGKIGQFILLGWTGLTANGSATLRWSGVDNPTSWPTANSATAIAQQSGEQIMDTRFGQITGIVGGDQHGLVFQNKGITRVTYVGPPAVFQFDTISENVGCAYRGSIVKAEGITYFVSDSGIFKTDGVSVVDIGDKKVSKYLINYLKAFARIVGTYHVHKKLVCWAFCNSPGSRTLGAPNELLFLDVVTGKFTHADQNCESIVSTTSPTYQMYGVNDGGTIGSFRTATSVSATSTVETGDIEFNPGGFTRLQGAKALVDLTSTSRAIAAIYSNEIESGATTTGAVTATQATGFSDFNIEARYFRMRFTTTTVFDQLKAMEFKALPSGSR